MIKLIVDRDDDSGLWYFIVQQDGETLRFTPGFRTWEEAQRVGDAYIREQLGAQPAGGEDE